MIIRDFAKKILRNPSSNRELGALANELTDSLYFTKDSKEFALGILYKALIDEVLKNAFEDDAITDTKAYKKAVTNLARSMLAKNPDKREEYLLDFGENFHRMLKSKKFCSIKSIEGVDVYSKSVSLKNVNKLSDYLPDLDYILSDPDQSREVKKRLDNELKTRLREHGIDRLCFIEKRKGPIGALLLFDYIVSTYGLPAFIYRTSYIDTLSRIKGQMPMPEENISIIYDLVDGGGGIKKPAEYLRENYLCKVPMALVLFDFGHGGKNKLAKEGINLYSLYDKSEFDKYLKEEKKSREHKVLSELAKIDFNINDEKEFEEQLKIFGEKLASLRT